jgi:hypothetical protein
MDSGQPRLRPGAVRIEGTVGREETGRLLIALPAPRSVVSLCPGTWRDQRQLAGVHDQLPVDGQATEVAEIDGVLHRATRQADDRTAVSAHVIGKLGSIMRGVDRHDVELASDARRGTARGAGSGLATDVA